MVGMLLVQDLAVVPLMIVLPELGASSGDPWRVALAVGRSLLLLGAIVVAAVWIVPRLMAAIARWNSRELFLLATLTVALGVGYAAWASGLSLALGAIVAGLVVNESDYAHRALSDIVPLRDLFGMLFFVSVGMLLDPVDVWRHAGEIALVVGAVLVVKATVFAAVVRLFGYRRVVPLAAGLTLFQVGEFAFVLARVGLTSGAITSDLYALVLNTAVATMALTPAVSALTPIVYERFSRRRQTRDAPEIVNAPPAGVASHVIVAGAGRVGRTVAQTLRAAGRPFVLIELDERRMRDARTAGLPIVYGDAAQPVILDAAGLDAAVALMVTVPAFPDVRQIVEVCRQRRPDLAIVARADSREAADALRALGVEEATSPELEAALAMTRSALARLGVDAGEIGRLLDAARRPQS
jgi:CPA2 family monovalent cation:H+ antiporter-2